jgi:hypothetical protein
VAIDYLRRWLARLPALPTEEPLEQYRRTEYETFVLSLFETIGSLVEAERLERHFDQVRTLDLALLDQALAKLAELPLKGWSFKWNNGHICDPGDIGLHLGLGVKTLQRADHLPAGKGPPGILEVREALQRGLAEGRELCTDKLKV